MLALIDNYDSFTYNLAQYLGELGQDVHVFRNDALRVEALDALAPDAIVISPGPGDPDDAGISREVIRQLGPRIPTVGGMPGTPVHWRCLRRAGAARNLCDARQNLRNLSPWRRCVCRITESFHATRYHSLIVAEPLPAALIATAHTADGVLMGLRHREYPIFGVQFHPESILTDGGKKLLMNFLQIAHAEKSELVDLEEKIHA